MCTHAEGTAEVRLREMLADTSASDCFVLPRFNMEEELLRAFTASHRVRLERREHEGVDAHEINTEKL